MATSPSSLEHITPARLRARPGLFRRLPRPGSWTVHATVDEPTELLCAFVAYYKALGADEIWLALDRPRPDQVALLRTVPGVRLTLCTPGYWLRTRGLRPDLHVVRQTHNATHAYRACRSEWFLECDADEFLLPAESIAALLNQTPKDTPFLRFSMAERIFPRRPPPQSIFDGMFRTPIDHRPVLLQEVYGDAAAMLRRGMTGHTDGKCMTRTGLWAGIWLHYPRPLFRRPHAPDVRAMVRNTGFSSRATLLHFDGLTPFHWRLKLMRKLLVGRTEVKDALRHNAAKRGPQRQAQIAAVFGGRHDPDQLAALDRLQFVPRPGIRRLRQAGGILDGAPDIVAITHAQFPGVELDFSIAGFNRRLRVIHADSIDRLGLPPGPD